MQMVPRMINTYVLSVAQVPGGSISREYKRAPKVGGGLLPGQFAL